ncbi:type II and III secretion system protein family protein [Devosia sp.]|uniref:type II and III secretion system protein family protein n=1 Tax=Devosia sp. TaxID=1871048 RepID=UPI002EE57F4D
MAGSFALRRAGIVWQLAVAIIAVGCLGSTVSAPRAQTLQIDMSRGSVQRIALPVSRSVTVSLDQPVGELLIANVDIADAQPITDKTIYVIGKAQGTTTINLFSPTKVPLGLLEIEVGVDVADISRAIRQIAPDADVKVGTVNGRVRLSGTVGDAETMQKVLQVVGQYGSDQIINAVTLSGGQQVNLEVRILEASRSAGRELGINWRYGPLAVNPEKPDVVVGTYGAPGGAGAGAIGSGTFQNGGIGLITDGAPGQGVTGNPSFATFITNIISGAAGGMNLDIIINALENKGLVRKLAEPNLTTLSGQEARFQAGGEVPIRVSDGKGGFTVEYKKFGVQLKFVPVVLNDDRIQIRLSPDVSEVSGTTPTGDLIFSTRNLDSVIELRDGQSFSVAGLLQSTNRKVQSQLPWIGQIPVLGALFRSSSYQKEETELVVIVTPRLVRPSTPGMEPASPLDQARTSNDVEFFLLGQMEVTKKMIRSYETGEGVVGPFGHMIDLDTDGMVYAKH